MLTVNSISKSFGPEIILSRVSFTLNPGERLGLIGPNGCGKTTLLRILAGEEQPDSGSAHFDPTDLRLGYLTQGFTYPPGETLGRFVERMEGDLSGLSARLEALAVALAVSSSSIQAEYDRVLSQLALASENAGRGPDVLAALGLDGISPDLPIANLSGGQKTRLALAGLLISNPQLILLDEPTNHLDIEMLEWLEDWLANCPNAVLIVSHDRAFLDHTATGILELDPVTHGLKAYPGNYSDYVAQKAAERQKNWQMYHDQQDEIARLSAAAARLRDAARFHKGGKADSGDKFARGFFKNRARGTVGRAKNVEARIDRLIGEDRIDKPRQSWEMKIEFGETRSSGRDVVVLENLSIGYGALVLLRDLNQTLRFGSRCALIGPNGCGKTTLVRTIAGMLPPLKGRARLGSNVRPGYMDQEQAEFDPQLNALETIRKVMGQNDTEVRSFLSLYLFKGDDVFTPSGKLSYGERARLSLAGLVAQGCNFLILDEPINHLDIPARSRFEQALAVFPGTVLAVVHDRYFIAAFAGEVWEVVGEGIQVIRM